MIVRTLTLNRLQLCPELVPVSPGVGLVGQPAPGLRDPVARPRVPGRGVAGHRRGVYLLNGRGDSSLPGGGPEHSAVARDGGKDGEEGKQERGHAATQFLRPLVDTSISVSFSIHTQGLKIEYKHFTSVKSLLADNKTFNI